MFSPRRPGTRAVTRCVVEGQSLDPSASAGHIWPHPCTQPCTEPCTVAEWSEDAVWRMHLPLGCFPELIPGGRRQGLRGPPGMVGMGSRYEEQHRARERFKSSSRLSDSLTSGRMRVPHSGAPKTHCQLRRSSGGDFMRWLSHVSEWEHRLLCAPRGWTAQDWSQVGPGASICVSPCWWNCIGMNGF